MLAPTYTRLIDDLRFALEVMEDRSHLGLNAERAATLKALMEHRISEAEQAFIRCRMNVAPVEAPRKKLLSA
jgi:hypothetical protein